MTVDRKKYVIAHCIPCWIVQMGKGVVVPIMKTSSSLKSLSKKYSFSKKKQVVGHAFIAMKTAKALYITYSVNTA